MAEQLPEMTIEMSVQTENIPRVASATADRIDLGDANISRGAGVDGSCTLLSLSGGTRPYGDWCGRHRCPTLTLARSSPTR